MVATLVAVEHTPSMQEPFYRFKVRDSSSRSQRKRAWWRGQNDVFAHRLSPVTLELWGQSERSWQVNTLYRFICRKGSTGDVNVLVVRDGDATEANWALGQKK